jgi:hypothetical protein
MTTSAKAKRRLVRTARGPTKTAAAVRLDDLMTHLLALQELLDVLIEGHPACLASSEGGPGYLVGLELFAQRFQEVYAAAREGRAP